MTAKSSTKYKYVCITTNHPDIESNPNPYPTTKRHAIVYIQLNIVACPTYPNKFARDMLLHRLFDFRL